MANDNNESKQQSGNNINNIGIDATSAGVTGATTIQDANDAAHKDIGNDKGDFEEQTDKLQTDLDPTTTTAATTCARGKLNDLVADLCIINGALPHGRSGLGDYTNIRATLPVDYIEADIRTLLPPTTAASSVVTTTITTQPTQNSSFSFKHFLNSTSSSLTAPSSTVTSLDPATSSNVAATNISNTLSTSTSASTSKSLQTSTGARPKVPQSASVSATSISSLISGSGGGGAASQDATSLASTKMKRSPRFSSFDSQASLAEYAGANSSDIAIDGCSGGGSSIGNRTASTGFRLYPDALGGGSENNDFFVSSSSSAARNSGGNTHNMVTTNSSDFDRQYVPRSYSNYDMPMTSTSAASASSSSPRRRLVLGGSAAGAAGAASKESTRPTRLSLNTSMNAAAKLKLDLPIESCSMDGSSKSAAGAFAASGSIPPTSRPQQLASSASDFPPAAVAAALPDFVQDHWMDSWYAHEMHLNSPPNSPIRAFVEDYNVVAAAGDGVASGGGIVAGNNGGCRANVESSLNYIGSSGGVNNCSSGNGGTSGVVASSESTGNSKMLPDFLSDGPIIHSSQRLADVAAGLPSNSIGSPDLDPTTLASQQRSRLIAENMHLKQELSESRTALSEQTRRVLELEQQLRDQQQPIRQTQPSSAAGIRSVSQTAATLTAEQEDEDAVVIAEEVVATENVEKSKRRSMAMQNNLTKLKQQIAQLTSEVEMLRRENELLREEGAVGGCSIPSCDRPRSYAAAGVTAASGATAAAASVAASAVSGGRPSRTQHISRDLLRAASNAENNLKQLLAGVDNLRQMAADIEHSECQRLDYDVSPDLFSDFLDDCEDYEEYPGGPAL